MGQIGFCDLDKRLNAISAKGDPLETIETAVPWEDFRPEIEAATRPKPAERKSKAGRKPYDAILMFKVLVLQTLHNLADEQIEYLIRDRFSFMRFLNLGLEDSVPDAATVWLFREALVKAGLVEKLFDRFDQHLAAKGYIARCGRIVDATIVAASRQRNSREESEAIKTGKTPEGWADSAYWSAEIEAKLKAHGYKSRIHRQGKRNRPLSEAEQVANTARSKVRARVEHIFGHQENAMGRKIVRTIGMARAAAKIGLMNPIYNMQRLVQLERVAPAPARVSGSTFM